MTQRHIEMPVCLKIDYEIQTPENASRWILLMHGYSESGAKILSKCEAVLPKDAIIIAPNAPFPVPIKKDQGYKLGYMWSLYDSATDEYVIDPKISVQMICDFMQKIKTDHLPLTIIGYSQGGYLAPFVAQRIKETDHVVGIACEFLVEELRPDFPFRLDGIHGDQDDIVNPQQAEKSHQVLKNRGVAGEFQLLKDTGHRIDEKMQNCLKSVLQRR